MLAFWRWLTRWFWWILGYRYEDEFRLIPVIGPFVESGLWDPTPQYVQWPVTKRNLLMAFKMRIDQQTTLSVKITDKAGNPAEVEGTPEWIADNNLAALKPAPDGMTCVLGATGGLGTSTITFKADGDLGQGTKLILGTLDVEFTGGQAAVAEITAAPPTDRLVPTQLPGAAKKK